MLATLEQQYVVVTLLRDMIDRGLSSPSEPSTGSSRSRSAPWSWRRTSSTAIPWARSALLGPTRMDYPQALAAVEVVSQRLGERLSDG